MNAKSRSVQAPAKKNVELIMMGWIWKGQIGNPRCRTYR
jgi:hypothetical protein